VDETSLEECYKIIERYANVCLRKLNPHNVLTWSLDDLKQEGILILYQIKSKQPYDKITGYFIKALINRYASIVHTTYKYIMPHSSITTKQTKIYPSMLILDKLDAKHVEILTLLLKPPRNIQQHLIDNPRVNSKKIGLLLAEHLNISYREFTTLKSELKKQLVHT
jgi:hypothetical protein